MTKRRTAKEITELTKSILVEASEFYKKPASEVTSGQFTSVSNGRLAASSILNAGMSFSSLRDYLFPSSKKKMSSDSADMIKRILGINNGKK
jgi:hypothetical protein